MDRERRKLTPQFLHSDFFENCIKCALPWLDNQEKELKLWCCSSPLRDFINQCKFESFIKKKFNGICTVNCPKDCLMIFDDWHGRQTLSADVKWRITNNVMSIQVSSAAVLKHIIRVDDSLEKYFYNWQDIWEYYTAENLQVIDNRFSSLHNPMYVNHLTFTLNKRTGKFQMNNIHLESNCRCIKNCFLFWSEIKEPIIIDNIATLSSKPDKNCLKIIHMNTIERYCNNIQKNTSLDYNISWNNSNDWSKCNDNISFCIPLAITHNSYMSETLIHLQNEFHLIMCSALVSKETNEMYNQLYSYDWKCLTSSNETICFPKDIFDKLYNTNDEINLDLDILHYEDSLICLETLDEDTKPSKPILQCEFIPNLQNWKRSFLHCSKTGGLTFPKMFIQQNEMIEILKILNIHQNMFQKICNYLKRYTHKHVSYNEEILHVWLAEKEEQTPNMFWMPMPTQNFKEHNIYENFEFWTTFPTSYSTGLMFNGNLKQFLRERNTVVPQFLIISVEISNRLHYIPTELHATFEISHNNVKDIISDFKQNETLEYTIEKMYCNNFHEASEDLINQDYCSLHLEHVVQYKRVNNRWAATTMTYDENDIALQHLKVFILERTPHLTLLNSTTLIGYGCRHILAALLKRFCHTTL